jgi:hypothetical protein
MKKNIMAVIVMSFMVTIYSCNPMAYGGRAVENDDSITYTVERTVFLAHFEMSTTQDIIFTKVFSKNKLTQQIELLFELKEKIYYLCSLNGDIYVLTKTGIYKHDGQGNSKLIIEEIIIAFAIDEHNIFYCVNNLELRSFQIVKSDLEGNNKTIMVEGTFANKLTIVSDFLVYSDGIERVGKVLGADNVPLINNLNQLVFPGPVVPIAGTHFVIDDKIIISGYMEPEGFEKYGKYPTIILDFYGKVIDVWENCLVRSIEESNGIIYAVIDNMRADGGNTSTSSGLYYITDDFTGKHFAFDNVWPNGFQRMYIEEKNIYFLNSMGGWTKGDILEDGTIENMVGVGGHREKYPDPIEVVILRANASGDPVEYIGGLVEFDVLPTMENDRVLVPMRAIFEALGATVDWDNDTETVTAKKDGTEISLKIGSDVLYKNGEKITLDVPAKIVNNRVLVPIRAVSEGLGARVEWNGTTQVVLIWAV